MYLVLYRKYRPKTFEDVVGQPHITLTLKNEVAQNKTAHAYLFTGPRGTGKTTCSKILAMAVNCLSPKDGNPCLECENCRAIDEGSTLDVVEIDAASNNGVDNIRQLREEAVYTPTSCKYRVYIIDETHMLSAGAFNALLKIMEEPPPHVKFILATTEAHKVPATILSRCQRFDFRRISPENIAERLLWIADKEPFTLSEEAAALIARLADGGMRDGCSLLDQCISFSGDITAQTVSEAVGVADREYLFDLTDCLYTQDASRAVVLINELYSMSKDMQGLLEEWIEQLRSILLTATLKEPGKLLAIMPAELERCKEYSEKISGTVLLHALSALRECLDGMSRGTDGKLAVELCLIRLCSPSAPVNTVPSSSAAAANFVIDDLTLRIAKIEAQLIKKAPSSPATPASPSSPSSPAKAASIRNELAQTANFTQTQPAGVQSMQAESVQAESVRAESARTESAQTESVHVKPVPYEPWADILLALSAEHPPLFGILESARAFCDGTFLYLDTKSPTASILLKQEGNATRLLDLIEAKTGARYKIRMKAGKTQEAPPAASPLDDILKKARETGVEVQEN